MKIKGIAISVMECIKSVGHKLGYVNKQISSVTVGDNESKITDTAKKHTRSFSI